MERSGLSYPAKGCPKVAERLEQLLEKNKVPTRRELKRSLDHGTWVLLSILFPDASVPVIQCSIDSESSVEMHYEIGKSIAPLTFENVLIIGSGVTVHNLSKVKWRNRYQSPADEWAVRFDDWLLTNLEQRNLNNLFNYSKKNPNSKLAVPTPDHFVPLFIAFGAGSDSNPPKLIERFYEWGNVSYLSLEF